MSQQLLDLVNSDAAAKAAFDVGNDQGAIDALNAATVTQMHTGRKQAGEVMAVLEAASIDPSSVLTTVASGANELLKSFLRVLEGQGADFSTDGNQSILAQYPDVAVRDVLLGIGRSTVSPAQDAIERAVTLADMTAARAVQDQQTLEQQWAAEQNSGINAAVAAGDRTALVAALRASATTLEAG